MAKGRTSQPRDSQQTRDTQQPRGTQGQPGRGTPRQPQPQQQNHQHHQQPQQRQQQQARPAQGGGSRPAQGGGTQPARQPKNGGSGRGALKSQYGTDPDMVEIVELFVREMPERVEGLNNCWRERKLESLRTMAHQLKGASGGYGYPAVGNAAAALEMSLKSVLSGNAHVDLETIRKQLEELVELCRSVTVK